MAMKPKKMRGGGMVNKKTSAPVRMKKGGKVGRKSVVRNA